MHSREKGVAVDGLIEVGVMMVLLATFTCAVLYAAWWALRVLNLVAGIIIVLPFVEWTVRRKGIHRLKTR